ncbi:CbtB domain-containing protein [Streptomyces iconiensis]|uniref:CbtB-domain containing protein n=1 Tax=Streptomyces iconiensis TaxID=1384038 RepID=A0ABT6ZW25_9ACTN|nr:CbtB-domain containing protein [Streptomyces iconiensis]MDJ1133277.1 CbtB-domain containing protein [Streptomyces iconiensis]
MSPHTAGTTAAPQAPSHPATVRTRDWMIVAAAAVLALIALYAVFVDNGNLVSATGGYLHEFSHDGRHLFGAPCH